MRSKEEAADYRYFQEPDLPLIEVGTELVERIASNMPELPGNKLQRLMNDYGLSEYEADILVDNQAIAQYFEDAITAFKNKQIINWVLRDVLGYLKEEKLTLAEFKVTPEILAQIIELLDTGKINSKAAREVFETIAKSGGNPQDIVKEKDSLIKKYEDMLYGGMDAGEDGMLPSEIIQELKEEVEDLEKERRRMMVDLEMLKEDNAEMDMKIVLLEEEKGRSGKGGGGEGGDFRPVEGRASQTSEFSGGLENFLITYSDMVTLILVVFVLMYSVSKLDENKFAEALSSFQTKRMRIESVNVRLSKAEMKMLERVRLLVKDNVDAESLSRSDTRTILHLLPTSDLFAPGDAFFSEGAEDLIISTIQEDMK